MKSYTVESPAFSDSIQITETTDMAHADHINAGPKQLLENTLANKQSIDDLIGAPEAYEEGTSYSEGDCCTYGEKIYICISATTGEWDESCWEVFSFTKIAEEMKSIKNTALSVIYEADEEVIVVRAGS